MNRLLNFPTEEMALRDQRHLVDALTTIHDVISGLEAQPRFEVPGGYSDAGSCLERLRVWVGFEIDQIRDIAAERPVETLNDADEKFEIVLGGIHHGGECAATVVAKLATLVSDMDWQLRMKHVVQRRAS